MRIGIDGIVIAGDRTGGVETYASELLRALTVCAAGHELIVFVQPAFRERLALSAPNLRYVDAPASGGEPGQRVFVRCGWLPYRAREAGVDVLHHLANYGAPALGYRSVLTLHDVIPRFYFDHALSGDTLRIGRHLIMLMGSARLADHVITVSEDAGRRISEIASLDQERLSVIPIAPKRLPAPPIAAELERDYFLAIGSASPHKNLTRLFRAYLKALPSRPLLVAGVPGWVAGEHAFELRELVAMSGGRIRMLGAVSDEMLAGLYAGARALLFPSLIEGFGLPPLEAASIGCPAAVSDIPVQREVMADAAIYFDPWNEASIAAALLTLDRDDGIRASLATRARRRAEAFSWARTARATLDVYERARGSHRLAARDAAPSEAIA